MELTCRRCLPTDWLRVRAMYLEFEPRGAFQGLPPESESRLDNWLDRLCRSGVENFVVDNGERIVGHITLCPDPAKSEAELAIFVHQDWRGLGVGRTLLLGALNYGCKQLELDRVWLSVQGANPVALHLFESVGFRPVGKANPFAWELEMERPSHCAQCKGERCAVFRTVLPLVLRLPKRERTKP
jgi:diamine N-acetyltransferase